MWVKFVCRIATSSLVVALLSVATPTVPALGQSQGSTDRPESGEEYTVAGIYYFGCDGSHVDEVKQSVPVKVGDKFTDATRKQLKNKFFNAVWQATRCSPSDVALIGVSNHNTMIYVGLPGRSIVSSKLNDPPTGKTVMPAEGSQLVSAMMKTLTEALAENRNVHEDDSKGYSLSNDPELRKTELALRDWVLKNSEVLFTVLNSASDVGARQDAAQAIGYLDPSKKQIDALLQALHDSNGAVRNNAARALACIASSNKDYAAMIPSSEFVSMLNSPTWTDRNKAVFVLSNLRRSDSQLTNNMRKNALQGLVEMACWDVPHAGVARAILGAPPDGVSTEQLNKWYEEGNTEAVVNAFAPPFHANLVDATKPSVADLGIKLRDIFKKDQSDKTRTHALECYDELVKMEPLYKGTSVEHEFRNSLSLESFHLGQAQATAGNNQKAAEYFSVSLKNAQEDAHLTGNDPDKSFWCNYVGATNAYINNDATDLEKYIPRFDEKDTNRKICTSLLIGLKQYGSPNYTRDYHN